MTHIGWIDSHAHLLEDDYQEELEQIMERARNDEVVRILVMACSTEQAHNAIRQKMRFPMWDLATGWHPEAADDVSDEQLNELEASLRTGMFCAIGEIGLDYYWRKDNKEKQRDLFIKQLHLANRYDLPVSIHSRDASGDMYQILSSISVKKKGILHCYGGSVEMAREFVKLGYSISLAGPLTFKNAVTPKEVAKIVPLDRLFIETDCPYLTPHPFRGKGNEPAYVRYVGEAVCDLRGIKKEEFMRQLCQNYSALFSVEI